MARKERTCGEWRNRSWMRWRKERTGSYWKGVGNMRRTGRGKGRRGRGEGRRCDYWRREKKGRIRREERRVRMERGREEEGEEEW